MKWNKMIRTKLTWSKPILINYQDKNDADKTDSNQIDTNKTDLYKTRVDQILSRIYFLSAFGANGRSCNHETLQVEMSGLNSYSHPLAESLSQSDHKVYSFVERGIIIKFEILRRLSVQFGKKTPSKIQVYDQHKGFSEGQEATNLVDGPTSHG